MDSLFIFSMYHSPLAHHSLPTLIALQLRCKSQLQALASLTLTRATKQLIRKRYTQHLRRIEKQLQHTKALYALKVTFVQLH